MKRLIFQSIVWGLCLFSSVYLFAQEVKILVVMPQNFGANYNFNIEDFDEYGWSITLTGVAPVIQPCQAFGTIFAGCTAVTVDTLISEIADVTDFDCVAIMPAEWRSGNPYSDLLASPDAIHLIKTAADSGVVVWTTCAGARVLAAADVIRGKRVVTQDAFRSEIEAAGGIFVSSDHAPVTEGNIITTVRGQYYHVHNNQAIATALEERLRVNGPASKKFTAAANTISSDVQLRGALWAKTYGGVNADAGRAICETTDGGFVIAGFTYSLGQGYADAYVLKVDAQGNRQWEKTFGGSSWEYAYSVVQTRDRGFVIAGYTASFGAGSKDVFVIKLSETGEMQWEKTFGGADSDVGKAVCELPDGSLLVAGYTESAGAGEEDVYAIKLNSAGDELWSKTFGRNRSEMGAACCCTADGNIVIAGSTGTEPFSSGNMDYYLFKIDPAGNVLWEKAFGNTISAHPYDWANAVAETRDGSFVMAGNSDIRSPLDAYAVSADGDGAMLWQQHYGERFYDYANSIEQTTDGGFLICGAQKDNQTEDKNMSVIKTDSSGNEIWRKTFGGDGADWASDFCQTSDGCYVIVGHTKSFGAGNFDVFLIKISSLFPRFNAAPTSGHAPLSVDFGDMSLGEITGWQWDFDSDGITDSEAPGPSWIYNAPGNYDVTLLIRNATQADTVVSKNLIQVFDGHSALVFNGSSSKIVCPASASLNITENLTAEAWIYPENWGPNSMIGFGRIVEKQQFSLYLIDSSPAFNDHCLALQLLHAGGARSISMTPDSSIQLNTWQHIAVTYAGNGSEVKMYINGIEQPIKFTSAPAGLIADNSGYDLIIGNNAANGYGFKGTIDEVRLWNAALSTQQIFEAMDGHYCAGKAGMVGCWGMDEGSGAVVLDVSNCRNDGAIADAVWCQGLSLVPTSARAGTTAATPDHFLLYDNYPNPFNPETMIRFFLPEASPVKIVIYSVTGARVSTLMDARCEAGFHELTWNGTDARGNSMSSGVYFYKLTGHAGASSVKKMLLLK
ncbi:MAG: LamG-like jellyroll fold domain-containing protein [Candidatus Zhuqueibacterota bacterium]